MSKTVHIMLNGNLLATYQQVGRFWTGIYQERTLADIAKQLPFQFESLAEMKDHTKQNGFTLEPETV